MAVRIRTVGRDLRIAGQTLDRSACTGRHAIAAYPFRPTFYCCSRVALAERRTGHQHRLNMQLGPITGDRPHLLARPLMSVRLVHPHVLSGLYFQEITRRIELHVEVIGR